MSLNNIDIDMVFTYVDGYDAKFIKIKNKYITDEDKKYHPDSRDKGINEIIFSVNSVIKYIPWIRTIFIVTDNQIPPINKDLIKSGKVVIIDHKTIIEHKYLPTFNSGVIESYLHNIPGLSEIFLYNNDDMMHFNYVTRSDIYKIKNDKVSLKIIHTANFINDNLSFSIKNFFNSFIKKTFLTSCSYEKRIYYTIDYLKKINTHKLKLVHNHHTKILRKSTLKYIENTYSDKLTQMRHHRFRKDNYIQYLFFAINIDNILNNNTIIKNSRDVHEKCYAYEEYKNNTFNHLLEIRPKFVCLNSMNSTFKNGLKKLMKEVI
jgi:hypothetical protein